MTAKFIEDPIKAERIAEIVKAIAHPLRLRILSLLCDENIRVSDMCERLDARQAAVSQQLRILRMSGLVNTIRDENGQRYVLEEPRIRDLLQCLDGCKKGS